jgi:hypothetical protein
MGKAALDLPDTLKPAPAAKGTAVPSADDLLSQLAGSEIDRLLAEADVERTGAPASAEKDPAAPPPWQPPAIPEIELQASPLAQIAIENPIAPLTSPQDEVSAELDALFAELNNPRPKKAPAPPAPAPVQPQAATPDQTTRAVAAPDPAAGISAINTNTPVRTSAADDEELLAYVNGVDEAHSLDASAADIAAESAGAPVAAMIESSAHGAPTNLASAVDVDEASTPAPLPLILRPLEWINAPFNAIPDALRAALGKVAIATLINAVAVLLYVILFRARH